MGSLAKMEELIAFYKPGTIVLEDHATDESRRSPRIQALIRNIIALVEKLKINVAVFSPAQINKMFFDHEGGTKHARAELLAAWFPKELESRLPPKRRPWMSED